MDFLNQDIQAYSDAHSADEPELLKKISRETHLKVLKPRMLSGHFQGRLLSMLSKLIRPKRILEVGTYTGYSALCMAEGLTKDGLLYTLDVNEELEDLVNSFFDQSIYKDNINYLVGNAHDIIPSLDEKWDLVFIDADKTGYLAYYNMLIPKMAAGGIIIADNVLWSGKVLGWHKNSNDKDTVALKEFNEYVKNDDRVENVLLPIRDGLNVIRKL